MEGDVVEFAAVMVRSTGTVYSGAHHPEALEKAISAGEDVLDEAGDVDRRKVDADLFLTRSGRLISRSDAYLEFGVASSEDAEAKRR